MVSVRAAFGKLGSYLASALNIIQLAGWTAIMIIICAQSVDNITQILAGYTNVKLWMLIAGMISTFWALVGTPLWKWMQRIAVFSLAILCLFMTYSVLHNVSTEELLNWREMALFPGGRFRPRDSYAHFLASFGFRLLSFCSREPLCFLGDLVGIFLASSWMYVLGLLLALFYRSG